MRDSGGRWIKVLIIERSAGNKLCTVVRADGQGRGNPFVVESSKLTA